MDLDPGPWALDPGPWTLDLGLWTLEPGPWTLDLGLWTLEPGPWTLDSGLWNLDPAYRCAMAYRAAVWRGLGLGRGPALELESGEQGTAFRVQSRGGRGAECLEL